MAGIVLAFAACVLILRGHPCGNVLQLYRRIARTSRLESSLSSVSVLPASGSFISWLDERNPGAVGSSVARSALRVAHVVAMSAAIALGCRGGEPEEAPLTEVTVDSVAVPTPWYRSGRTLDLTGDGRVDSVHLDAVGARPDSLRITLSLFVNGEEKHRESWGSSYELALEDTADRVSPHANAVRRAKLDSVLKSVVLQRLDAPDVRLMAEDTTALAGLDPRPTHRVSFSYGYETTVRLVWDAPRERFVRLWSCC